MGTAPMAQKSGVSHDIVAVAAPSSLLPAPPTAPSVRFHRWVWSGATFRMAVFMVDNPSTTTSPTALVTLTVAGVADPGANTAVPSGDDWSTPVHEVAPPTTSLFWPKVATMLSVPDGGANKYQSSTRLATSSTEKG